MAKCYITCDVGADQSHVEAIQTWLTENGHEVVDSDISDDKNGVYIRIGRGNVIVKTAKVKTAYFSEEGPKIRRSENQEQLKSMIERVLDFLEKNHVEWL